jgi:periplasmic copper chaperone A
MRFHPSSSRLAVVRLLPGLFALGLALAAGQATAQFKTGPVTIEQPWARATPPGAEVAGGYFTIKNDGAEADRLVSVTAEIAGRAELHQMAVENGVMKMRPLDSGVEIPASGSVTFDPSGYHVMFMDLKKPLKEGDKFNGTLTFEKAGTVDVTYVVGPIGGTSMPMGDNGTGSMGSMGSMGK